MFTHARISRALKIYPLIVVRSYLDEMECYLPSECLYIYLTVAARAWAKNKVKKRFIAKRGKIPVCKRRVTH